MFALCAACVASLSCGGYYFVGFVSNPGGTTSIRGVVTAVSNGFISDPSGVTQYTAVTFINAESKATINFCGDQRSLFPIDTKVRADYTSGILCSVLVRVSMDNEGAESGLPHVSIATNASTPEYIGGKLVRPKCSCSLIGVYGPVPIVTTRGFV